MKNKRMPLLQLAFVFSAVLLPFSLQGWAVNTNSLEGVSLSFQEKLNTRNQRIGWEISLRNESPQERTVAVGLDLEARQTDQWLKIDEIWFVEPGNRKPSQAFSMISKNEDPRQPLHLQPGQAFGIRPWDPEWDIVKRIIQRPEEIKSLKDRTCRYKAWSGDKSSFIVSNEFPCENKHEWAPEILEREKKKIRESK